jgi:hypothetical protein
MEFLVQFELDIPDVSASQKSSCGRPPSPPAGRPSLVARADGRAQLEGLLDALPLSEWIRTSITPLAPHPSGPEWIRAIAR